MFYIWNWKFILFRVMFQLGKVRKVNYAFYNHGFVFVTQVGYGYWNILSFVTSPLRENIFGVSHNTLLSKP